MPTLGATDSAAVVEATMFINRLLQLDEVWTQSALAGPPSSAAASRDAWLNELAGVAGDLTQHLVGLGAQRAQLSALAERHDLEADEVLNELLWGDALDGRTREDLRWWVKGRSFGEVWSTADKDISDSAAESEVEQLEAQLTSLSDGLVIGGDLSKKFRCGSANGLLVGGILIVPGGVGVGAGIAAAGATGLAVGAGIATGGLGFLIAGTALWWARKHRC
jgi:hypothetical protein